MSTLARIIDDMRPKQSTSSRIRRPRVPLPRQIGGSHEDKTKRLYRKRKHKKAGHGSGGE
jgi:hypothetical protein